MKRAPWTVLLAAAALLLAGCTINAPQRTAPAIYDLGEPSAGRVSARAVPISAILLIPPVGAPPWLESTGITYRLAYESPRRLHAYSGSRWAATPATLLTEELRSRFTGVASGVVSAVDGTQAEYVLRVYLEDYTQTFEAADRARVTVRARATLVEAAARRVVAQHTFDIGREAAPDAAGAASALAGTTDELVENLLDWVAQNLKNTGASSTAKRSAR